MGKASEGAGRSGSCGACCRSWTSRPRRRAPERRDRAKGPSARPWSALRSAAFWRCAAAAACSDGGAVTDDADIEAVTSIRWSAVCYRGLWYARRNLYRSTGQKTTQNMHTLLTGCALTDHINGNGLDNRRDNLRPATTRQNQQNRRKRSAASSQFKGVYWFRLYGNWHAEIQVAGVPKSLGYFRNETDASHAYDAAAREHFGEFAALNFPTEHERDARAAVQDGIVA